MKMALQYWHARGETRQRFLTFRNGYHGDTFGAMSVCDPDNSMHSLWKGYLPENLFAPARKAASTASGTRWIWLASRDSWRHIVMISPP